MQATFGIKRELNNSLTLLEYKNVMGRDFHFHSQIEIILVEEGEIEGWIADKHYFARAGEMLIALSYESHVYFTPQFSRVRTIFLPTYMCDEFINQTNGLRVANHLINDTGAVNKLKYSLDALQDDNINSIEKTGHANVILGAVLSSLSFEGEAAPLDPSLASRLLFYINSNFKNEITPASLAAEFGYTEDYVASHFRSCFKIGIKKYVNSVRLKNALVLMKENKMNFTECAFESGFSSMRTFYRVFDGELGCTPKEYMKSIK